MEQLRDFFPALPEQRLLTALSLNGNNVSAAAQFLLNENENIVNSEVGTITSTLTYNNFNNDTQKNFKVVYNTWEKFQHLAITCFSSYFYILSSIVCWDWTIF